MVEKFIQILQIRLSPRIVQMLVKRNPNTNKKKRNFKRFVWCSVYKIQEISYRNGVEISSFHSFTNHFRNISIFSENFIHNSDRSFRCINFHVAWKKNERGTGDVPERKKYGFMQPYQVSNANWIWMYFFIRSRCSIDADVCPQNLPWSEFLKKNSETATTMKTTWLHQQRETSSWKLAAVSFIFTFRSQKNTKNKLFEWKIENKIFVQEFVKPFYRRFFFFIFNENSPMSTMFGVGKQHQFARRPTIKFLICLFNDRTEMAKSIVESIH